MKCSCGWKPKPGEMLFGDLKGNYKCPNCSKVLSYIYISHNHRCPMCQWIKEENDKIPESLKKQIRSRKGRFYGKLIKAIIKAGGYPKWFLPHNMEYITMEGLLNSLTSNDIEFKIFYKGEKQ